MKKLLTLVLCWVLAFSAMAETTFKAKTAASVAGGYITSLNKVDGSFEDGATQWSASVGTIVPTASTEFQGEKKGVWAGTGTGTVSLQWTATASNTYEASAQVNVNGEDDVYVCAYVGTTETGCKLIPALNKIQKVSAVADSVLSSAFYLRLKHTGSDAFSVDVDDGKIEPYTQQGVNLVEQQSTRQNWQAGNSYSSNLILFVSQAGGWSAKSGSGIYNDSVVSSHTRFNILKKAIFSGSFTNYNTIDYRPIVYLNGVQVMGGTVSKATSSEAQVAFSFEVKAGDFVEFGSASPNSTYAELNITASAISENIVQTYQPSEFLGEIKLLPSTTAPKGFIPADGKSIGKTSGTYQGDAYYALYAMRWTTASTTADEPYVISSAKGASAQADWDAGKTITIDVRGMFFRASGGNAGAVGTKQSDAFQDHYHFLFAAIDGTASPVAVTANDYVTRRNTYSSGYVDYSLNATATGATVGKASNSSSISGQRTSTETRPVNTSDYPYMRYGTSAPDLYALPVSKENRFTFSVSSTGVVSNNQNSVASGNAVVTDTSLYTIPLTSGIFSATPLGTASVVATDNRVAQVVSVSPTQIVVRTFVPHPTAVQVNATASFVVELTRSSDYTAPGVFVGNVSGNLNKTEGTSGVELFSFSYGTSNATTVCSASPCSYLDQIGSYVTSVTRGATGNYTANFSKTFAKLKCVGVSMTSQIAPISQGAITCTNCSSLSFQTGNPASAYYDTYATLMCQGQ